MAAVSELSMYQATAMKLEQDRDSQEENIQNANIRLAQDEAPTDDCDHEWFRMERDRIVHEEALINRRNELNAVPQPHVPEINVAVPSVDPQRTTAEIRPNSYISDDIGIPRPYGVLAPFKPTPLGANARHIRKPNLPDVEI